jgi:hypothetical protein
MASYRNSASSPIALRISYITFDIGVEPFIELYWSKKYIMIKALDLFKFFSVTI